MKNKILWIFLIIALVLVTGCQSTSSPTITPTFTSTSIPSTATMIPTSTVTPWPLPSNVTFCLDTVETEEEKETIRESIRKAHQYYLEVLGVEPRPILVYAGPDVNNLVGEGPCSDNQNLQRLRRDFNGDIRWDRTGGYAVLGLQVTNTNYFVWQQDQPGYRVETVAHEYFHELQFTLLGLGITGLDAGPIWIVEGSAEVMASSSQGTIDRVRRDLVLKIKYYRKTSLAKMEESQDDQIFWELSTIAVDYLLSIAPDQERSIVAYFSANPTRSTWKSAFKDAFGLTPEEFYEKFEAFQENGYE